MPESTRLETDLPLSCSDVSVSQSQVPVLVRGDRPWPEDDQAQLKRIAQFLPVLKRKRVGRFAYLHPEYVVQTANYERRDRELLELFDRGRLAVYALFWRTGYFRNQRRRKGRSTGRALRRINRYFRLFRSIRKEGLRSDPERVGDLAWIFCAEDVYFRMDGHHRTSVARYLGYREVPVMVVTPRDLLELPETPPDMMEYLRSLREPSCLPLLEPDAEKAVGVSPAGPTDDHGGPERRSRTG